MSTTLSEYAKWKLLLLAAVACMLLMIVCQMSKKDVRGRLFDVRGRLFDIRSSQGINLLLQNC